MVARRLSSSSATRPRDRLMKWVPGSEIEVFRTDAHGPAGNAFDAQGRLYTCETRTRRVTRTDKNGQDRSAGRASGKASASTRPTTSWSRKTGHVYFTDPAFGEQADHRELDFYGVYHIPPKGSDEAGGEARRPAARHRALAQRPDPVRRQLGRAQRARLRSRQERRAVERARADRRKSPASPAASRVDEKGNLYVAGQGHRRSTAPDGKRVHTDRAARAVPPTAASARPICKTLFITAGTRGLPRPPGREGRVLIAGGRSPLSEAPAGRCRRAHLRRDRILMAQRGKEPLKGWWSLPGGALETGESAGDAVRREVLRRDRPRSRARRRLRDLRTHHARRRRRARVPLRADRLRLPRHRRQALSRATTCAHVEWVRRARPRRACRSPKARWRD